jgi:hypothetical protein
MVDLTLVLRHDQFATAETFGDWVAARRHVPEVRGERMLVASVEHGLDVFEREVTDVERGRSFECS